MTPIFGRNDDLGDDVEPPPVAHAPGEFRVPGYRAEPIAFGAPPEEEIELTGEIPWELREDEAPSEETTGSEPTGSEPTGSEPTDSEPTNSEPTNSEPAGSQ